MKYLPLFVLLTLSCQPQKSKVESTDLVAEIAMQLEGEFNNFQQVWQENTKEDIHKVEVGEVHQHIHSVYEQFSSKDMPAFKVTHRAGRNSLKILGRSVIRFQKLDDQKRLISEHFPIESEDGFATLRFDKPLGIYFWSKEDDLIFALNESQDTIFKIKDNILYQVNNETVFQNKKKDHYRMHRCRFFSGWIQYPLPDQPDSTYRQANLKLHDQGDMAQLQFPDGTKEDYTVELTQLVYGKTIAIMKLAVYEMPASEVEFNSRSISYTWASPESKRIGINLRRIVSGWTLIEPGFLNSNNMKKTTEKK